MITVRPNGIYIPTHDLKKKLGTKYRDFTDKLKSVHKQLVGPVITYNVAPIVRLNDTFCTRLPRSILPSMSKLFKVKNELPELISINIEFIGELTEGQQLVSDYLLREKFNQERILAGTANTYLDMQTGYGKSYVLAYVIAKLKLKTLIVVATSELAKQMMNDLKYTVKCSYGMYNGPTIKRDGTLKTVKKHTEYDITIAIINTAIVIPDVGSKFSFIALDETQCFCSDVFGKIFEATPNVMMGMSATTDEKPSDFIAIKSIGPVLKATTVDGFSYDDVHFDIDVDVIQYHGHPDYTQHVLSTIGKMDARAMHAQFMEDQHRIKLVVDKIKEIYEQKIIVPMLDPDDGTVVLDDDTGEPIMEEVQHCIYIFAEELEHLRTIHKYISDIAWAPELEGDNDTIGMFTGGISDAQSKSMREKSRILLTTYGYSSKGVSVSKMTAIVFLTSRKAQMMQITGRILRRSGDRRIRRRIVDIVDSDTGIKRQYETRKSTYEFRKCNINISKVNYDEINIE
jgi:hypothetical protein